MARRELCRPKDAAQGRGGRDIVSLAGIASATTKSKRGGSCGTAHSPRRWSCVRSSLPGPVSEIGYVFARRSATEDEATRAAERYALIAPLRPERHLAAANIEFAVQ
jgi:hypothetical protein